MEEKKDGKFITFVKGLMPYVIIVVVVVLIRTFLVTPGIVNGDSMKDTLFDNDLVLINKIGLKSGIDRFDIVVIDFEDGAIIKRVIGLPGEKVEYIDNKLYINDEEISTPIEFETTNDFVLEAGKNEYIVLGDNRNISKDSRIIGPVNIENIKGKVGFRIFPFSKFGSVS